MNKFLLCCAIAVLGSILGFGQAEKKDDPSKAAPGATNEVAILKTTAGEIVLEFWPDVAPNSVVVRRNWSSASSQVLAENPSRHTEKVA